MTRPNLIVANARKVTPAQFLRRVMGPSPREIYEALEAMPDDEFEVEYQRALATGEDVYLMVGEKMRRVFTKPVQLTETQGDPLKRDAA